VPTRDAIVTTPDAELGGFAALVAVMVTVLGYGTVAGAVYRPAAEILPTAGLSDQVTAVFDVPVTAAVKVCVCEGVRVTLPGVNATLIGGGASATVALAETEESAPLVALTVTVCGPAIEAGAV